MTYLRGMLSLAQSPTRRNVHGNCTLKFGISLHFVMLFRGLKLLEKPHSLIEATCAALKYMRLPLLDPFFTATSGQQQLRAVHTAEERPPRP